MTLVSSTFSGYIVVAEVFIVGSVMGRQEGQTVNNQYFLFSFSCLRPYIYVKICCIYSYRLTNEQRAAIADYFRVYKVVHLITSNHHWAFDYMYECLLISHSVQGNENSLKKVSFMGSSLHPFLA